MDAGSVAHADSADTVPLRARSDLSYGSIAEGPRSGDLGRPSEESEDEEGKPPEHCPSGCGKDSVYRFIIVWPELYRIARGTYWSFDVCVPVLVLVLIVVCQVCIVWVAGGFILGQSSLEYRSSVQARMFRSSLPFPFDRLHLADGSHQVVEDLLGKKPTQECCRDASCFDELPCCMADSSHANHTGPVWVKPPRLDSTCFDDHGELDCSQDSFQLVGRWNEVDVDGDGHWSHEEAVADESNLGCRLQVDLAEIFRAVRLGIVADAKIKEDLGVGRVEIPHEVERKYAVPRAYFQMWEGMAVLCAVMDPTRCGALVAQGVFDGVLQLGGSKRWTLGKAVEYCGRLLTPGGVCDSTLPVSYAAHRQKFTRTCGQGAFHAGPTYVNPYVEHEKMRVLEVKYARVIQYELVKSATFKFYMGIMLLLWFFTLNKELRSVLEMIEFVLHFPAAHECATFSARDLSRQVTSSWNSLKSLKGRKAEKSMKQQLSVLVEKGAKVRIDSISSAHRLMCCYILVVRSMTLFYMLVVGVIYATCTLSYLDLLLNTVALAFVFELPAMFHEWLLPRSIKEQLDQVEFTEFHVKKEGRLEGNLRQSELFLGLSVIPLVCVVIVEVNDAWRSGPMLKVMRCACAQAGDHCKVGWHLGRDWWNAYWDHAKDLMG